MSRLSFNVLGIRDFRVTLISRLLLIIAWVGQDVIIQYQVYALTKDPFMLGLTGLVEAVPALICAQFSGHIVDISRPYRVFLMCIFGMMLNSIMLLLIGAGHIYLGNVVAWLFIGTFISGIIRSFTMPASFALLPQIVPRSSMPAASAWQTSNFQLGKVIAPALAGMMLSVASVDKHAITGTGVDLNIVWLMPISLLTVAFILYLNMSEKTRIWKSSEKREKAFKSIRQGWSYIIGNRTLLSIMALDMFAVLFGGAVSMLPAYADKVLHVGPQGYGWLCAATPIGSIFSALFLATRPFKQIRATTMLWVVVGFGISIIGFGLSTIFWVSMLCLIFSGVCDSISMVIRGTLMQLLTPDSMRGRVSSVNSMFIISSNEIGAFESGATARLFGLVPSVVIGGFCTLGVVALTALLSPKLRRTVVNTDSEKSA